jgi:predicted nucleic acid-binding protein
VSAIIIDANIWAYYFDRDLPEHKSVVGTVEKALKSEQIAINTTIIMELARFLIKNLGPVEGGEKLGLFLRFPLVISGKWRTTPRLAQASVRGPCLA